ncbi:bestrophin family protein [Flavihumibacter petaseus]|uniref:Multidrug transporter n=1 Tax=Flavihumibacter petaseus NBRC 106054 TaxID=1220578 RepID=A0A0E9N819_9BACT|nr:bestrophin family ion channel [Flavihumibacter petaseus]GAO45520.1 hypothetical protein FPE01S_06_00110 [Flavihumibacter petaseus NBRC 106054]
MYTGNHYNIRVFLFWTRRDIYKLLLIGAIPTVLYKIFNWNWLTVPWVPIALVGTAAAFIVGFKNTQTYNRLWEARQIWGSIVNSSRTWGIQARDLGNVPADDRKCMIYRHIAWLTALRYQLREPRSWENTYKPYNMEFREKYYKIPEWETDLETALKPYLTDTEFSYVMQRKNRAAQIIAIQSGHLKNWREKGWIGEFTEIEMQRRLADLYDQQGRCERIKNFPYPRQFGSINLYFIWIFVVLLPFGLLHEFSKLGSNFIWLTIPFSVLVSWVFTSMEKVGESTENPFEGSANDIPIATLSRTIEIDLRDMLGEKDLPAPIVATNKILL